MTVKETLRRIRRRNPRVCRLLREKGSTETRLLKCLASIAELRARKAERTAELKLPPDKPRPMPTFRSVWAQIHYRTAKAATFEVKRPGGGLPTYLRLNDPAMVIVNRIRRSKSDFWGTNCADCSALELEWELARIAKNLKNRRHTQAADNMRALRRAILQNTHPHDGLSIVGASSPAEATTVREELLHAVMQRRPGKGDTRKGVPWKEVMHQRGFTEMAVDIARQYGTFDHKTVVSEAIIDLLEGSHGLKPRAAMASARAYFEALADAHGTAPLKDALRVLDFIDKDATAQGITPPGKDHQVVNIITEILERRSHSNEARCRRHRGPKARR